jgi:Holliday junction resolvasome RuvABC endonuclease subunit
MDISLNHGAIVELYNGSLSKFWYYTDLSGSSKQSKNGFRISNFKEVECRQTKQTMRLLWIRDFVKRILKKNNDCYIGIEDYALSAERGSHYLGEVGGQVKLLCYDLKIPFRLHDPLSLKLFVTGEGHAKKEEVTSHIESVYGIDFSCYDQPPSKKNPMKQNKQTSQDLCDAFGLSQMVFTEWKLRHGIMLMSDLKTHQIRVFNRITKSYPVSLLDRDWILDASCKK